MDPVNILPILFIPLLALGTIFFARPILAPDTKPTKYMAIDGMRGFLAIFVFIHHSLIWYFFLRTNEWSFPASFIYSHLGPTSVAFFFMITAFLFFSKLIDSFKSSLDWLKLYVSRVTRIMPLYLFAIAILFLLVGLMTRFSLREPGQNVWFELGQWIAFMEPDINLLYGTRLIVAGVVWSLAFEWMFYNSLALVGYTFFRIRTSYVVLYVATIAFIGSLFILFYFYSYGIWNRMSPFLGGVAAAFLVRNEKIKYWASRDWVALILLPLMMWVLFFYPSVYELVPYLVVTAVFISIACGNTFFGILTHPLSRMLGQISYSIYLLHGILLFVTFQFIIGPKQARGLSVLEHWLVIAACSIALVIICSLTYHFIEKPCMNSAGRVTDRVWAFFKAKQPATS